MVSDDRRRKGDLTGDHELSHDEPNSRIEEIKRLIREMYADNPPWLQLSNVKIDTRDD